MWGEIRIERAASSRALPVATLPFSTKENGGRTQRIQAFHRDAEFK